MSPTLVLWARSCSPGSLWSLRTRGGPGSPSPAVPARDARLPASGCPASSACPASGCPASGYPHQPGIRGELSLQHHAERAAAAVPSTRPPFWGAPQSRTARLPHSSKARTVPDCPQPGSASPARSQHRPGGPSNRLSHCRAPADSSRRCRVLSQLAPPPGVTPPGELGPRLPRAGGRADAEGALQSHPSAGP